MIGRRSNVGQPVTPADQTKEQVRARESYHGADIQRSWGAETAEEVLRGLLREKDRELRELREQVASLKRQLGQREAVQSFTRRSA